MTISALLMGGSSAFGTGFLSSCDLARAQSQAAEIDIDAALAEALAAHEAEIAGAGTAPSPTPVSVETCLANEVLWNRGGGIQFCTPRCSSDLECAFDERCRVLDFERPDELVLAAEVFTEVDVVGEAQGLPAGELPIGVDVPLARDVVECEEACTPYTGDLTIRPSAPVAVCDLFWDAEGALLLPEEEEAIESGTTVDDAVLVDTKPAFASADVASDIVP